MNVRRPILLVALAVAIIVPFLAVQACGPDWSPDIFVRTVRPDDLEAFASGHLGILQTGFDSTELAVAYRYLNGGKLFDKERAAYHPSRRPVRDWTKLTPEQVEAARAAEKAALPPNAWRSSRDKYLPQGPQPEKQQGLPGNYGDPDVYFDPGDQRCFDSALQTATLTLDRRAATWGKQSPWLIDWIRGQDAVFFNCAGKGTASPLDAPQGAPALLRADRAYQKAAAAFYAGRLDEARDQFEAIARDHDSPWHYLGNYLAARALVRKAFSMGTQTDSWSGELATFDLQTMQSAQEMLQALLLDHDPELSRQTIERELNFVRIRTEPDKRIAEICAALQGPGPDENFGQDLRDLDYVLIKHLKFKDPPPLLAWISALRSSDAAAAFSVWRQNRSLPWLVAALVKAGPADTVVPDLITVSASAKPGDPAWDTLTFHRIRLLTGLHRDDEARTLLDQFLPTMRRQPPDSRLNAFLGERMAVARTFDEFLTFSPRKLLDEESSGYWSFNATCGRGAEANLVNDHCPADDGLGFDQDAVTILNRQTPLAMLVNAAASSSLPPNLRRDLMLAGWTRSVLLGDAASATALAPHLPESIRKTVGTNIGFPATLAILRNPGLRPYVEPGISHLVMFSQLDDFRNNWWCDDWWGQFASDPWADGALQPARFFTEEQRASADAEFQRLRQLPCAPAYLGQRVIDYASQNPSDPDIPEALALTVRGTRYACVQWGTNKDNAARNSAISKAAFQLLHRRYPKSPWTAKTPYYY